VHWSIPHLPVAVFGPTLNCRDDLYRMLLWRRKLRAKHKTIDWNVLPEWNSAWDIMIVPFNLRSRKSRDVKGLQIQILKVAGLTLLLDS
jgi:hypothetical protein